MRPKRSVMLPHQEIELRIYKYLKPHGFGGVSTTLGVLSRHTGEDHGPLIDRLKALYADGRVSLYKFIGQTRTPYSELSGYAGDFFSKNGFIIEIAPRGREYFESLESQRTADERERVVFISCGQSSPTEIALGKKLAATVDTEPGYKGYFAENQNSFAGLSSHIFQALENCAGFVGVMHHRGQVETLGGRKGIRGSVWIEQEIAIAHFLPIRIAIFP